MTWRDAFIDACVVSAIALVGITETLSTFNGLTRPAVFASWALVAVALSGWFVWKRTKPALIERARVPDMTREEKLYIAFMAFICLVVLYVALAGQPNAHDSQTYHLPRVLRWAQDRTLDFFPTHNLRQLWIGPGWEYFAIQLKLISGTDALASLVQWGSMVATPVVVSVIARELGAGRKGQLLAALFCLSIPMGIAQGSGAQVDLFSGFWLAISVALLLRIKRLGIAQTTIGIAILLGASVGMAVLSKATSVLFLLPFVVWVGASLVRRHAIRFACLSLVAMGTAAAINAGHMARNTALFGSPLGIRGSQGVMNEALGPGILASNILRNAILHLNTPLDNVNAQMTAAIVSLHASVGMDANDPRSTFENWRFEVPPEWDDEGQSSNQLHFLLIIAVTAWLTFRRRTSAPTRFLWCAFAGALVFCLVLKWQPWHSRLHLPLFMISGGAVGAGIEQMLKRKNLRWVAAALALTALHPTFRNNFRPLLVRRPLFVRTYAERLVPGRAEAWKVYAGAMDVVAKAQCSRIGLIDDASTREYPVWKLLERRSGATPEIRHVGVTNVSRSTESDRDRAFRPCAIIAIDHDLPKSPAGFVEAWKHKFITVFLPAHPG